MKRLVGVIGLLATTQTGCIVVGGFSNTGGWFFWPGGLGLLLVGIVLFFVYARHRR